MWSESVFLDGRMTPGKEKTKDKQRGQGGGRGGRRCTLKSSNVFEVSCCPQHVCVTLSSCTELAPGHMERTHTHT